MDTCSNNTATARNYGSSSVCVSRLTMQCLLQVMAPGSGQTPTTVGACAAAIAGLTCSAWRSAAPVPACDVTGTQANGTSCVADAQCTSGVCLAPKNSQCGTCADQPVDGADCSNTGCGRGLLCHHSGTTYTCRTPVASGMACDTTMHPCDSGLTCVRDHGMTTGTCQAFVTTVGGTCSFNSLGTTANPTGHPDCDSFQALDCGSNNMCIANTLVTAGQTCGFNSTANTFGQCQSGASCITMAAGDGGADAGTVRTCIAPATEGQACDTSAGPDCMGPARCILTSLTATAGTCQLFNPSACN
jgi:hypothetical protein